MGIKRADLRASYPFLPFGDCVLNPSNYFIYLWVRGEKVLYIGCSCRVVERLVIHGTINTKEPFLPTDKLLFIERGDKQQAYALEKDMIVYFKPKYNKNKRKYQNTYNDFDYSSHRAYNLNDLRSNGLVTTESVQST